MYVVAIAKKEKGTKNDASLFCGPRWAHFDCAQCKVLAKLLFPFKNNLETIKFQAKKVVPDRLEPSTPCPESFRESQVLLVSFIIFSLKSGYFARLRIYFLLFIDFIFRSNLIACANVPSSNCRNNSQSFVMEVNVWLPYMPLL